MYEVAIKVVYSAFSERLNKPETSFTFKLPESWEGLENHQILNNMFEITNLQQGEVWDSIKNNLPQERTHTSLSVGDKVVIQFGKHLEYTFKCADVGWDYLAK